MAGSVLVHPCPSTVSRVCTGQLHSALSSVRGSISGAKHELLVKPLSVPALISSPPSVQRRGVRIQAKVKAKEEVKEEKKKEKKEKKEREKGEKTSTMEQEAEPDSPAEEVEEPIISTNGKAGKKSSKEEKKAAKKAQKLEPPLQFVKYQGLGNDFLLVDNRESSETKVTPEQAVKLCDRNFGVGADGVIFALPGVEGTEYTMRIFNADGSEPEMCGNGIRCMARFVAELEGAPTPNSYRVSTPAGVMVVDLREDGQVAVDMGPPTLAAADVPTTLPPNGEHGAVVGAPLEVDGKTWRVTCVSMGNPHCITFSYDGVQGLDVAALDLARIGPMFERHPVFPARTNTEFVEVLSRSELKMRVWERGAGPTLACGTGACALVVAAVLEGRADRKCTVHLPGGPLEIEWREEDNHVYMTGPAEVVFQGKTVLQ